MEKYARLRSSYLVAAAFIFVATLVTVRASIESGMNDDWSFIRTARDLALTGHLRYNAWSAPLIGFQAYWGALFIKLFGFSFLAVRASVYVLTLLSLPVFWALFRSAGLTERQSFFGILVFLLSPLNLPNLTTFMTDMPAFFLFAGALLGAMKAWNEKLENRAMLWVCVTTLCGILAGSVRQIYWLSGLCFLAVLALTRIRSTRGRLLILVCIGVTLGICVAASHWLGQQPYVPADTTLQDLRRFSWRDGLSSPAAYLGRYLIGLAVLCTPISLLLAVHSFKRLPAWVHSLVFSGTAVIIRHLAEPLPWLGNTLSQDGVILRHTISVGEKPLVLPPLVILVIASVGVISAAYALASMAGILRHLKLDTATGRLTALVVPFLLAYMSALVIRSVSFGLYDRYLVPVVFCAGILLLSAYARNHDGIGRVSWIVGGVFALYAVATTHDYFAEARAKLAATEQLLQAGHARQEIMSGFEFDAWTQVDLTGHINNDLVTFPKDAYREADDCNGANEVQMWWRSLAPDVKARYVISLTPIDSLLPSEFKPLEYRRWLPPVQSYIYVSRTPEEAPLTCSGS